MRGRSVGRSRGTLRSDDERGADQGFGKRGGGNSGQQRWQEVQGPLPLLRQNAVQVMPFLACRRSLGLILSIYLKTRLPQRLPLSEKGDFPPAQACWFSFEIVTKKTPPGGWRFRDSKPPEGVVSCRVLCTSLGNLPKFGTTHTSTIAACF